MLSDPSWVFRQYDHQLFLNTVDGPGGDAAVLRLSAPGLPRSERGLALDHRLQPDLVQRHRSPGWYRSHRGRRRAQRGLCRGSGPWPVVNCLNFGNPEHPEVMWQLSQAVDGMSEACVGPRTSGSSAAT